MKIPENQRRFIFDSKNQEAMLICTKPIEESNHFSTTLLLDFIYDYKLVSKNRLTMIQ